LRSSPCPPQVRVERLGRYSAPTYLISFATNDPDDLKRLADIGGGLDTKALRREIALLRRHELMLIAPRERPPVLLRSRVEQ
jgi:hypothetical protein